MLSTLVLWNPKSGRASEVPELHEWLSEQPDVVVHETHSHVDAAERAARAAERGFQRIVAAGGDGAVNAAINGLRASSSQVSLAVLPTGTANDFARTLGIPTDLSAAARLALSGRAVPIDLVQIEREGDQTYFANAASGGNSEHVSQCMTPEMKREWGAFCYLRGAVGVVSDLATYKARVQFDDEPPIQLAVWNVIIANGRFNAGHLEVAPRAHLDDGLMDVVLIRDGSVLDLVALTARFVATDYLDAPQVLFRQVRSLQIDSDPPMCYSLDGEAWEHRPTGFRCIPGAVNAVFGDEAPAGRTPAAETASEVTPADASQRLP